MMNLNDNLDKLPKWAQSEVKVLQMRVQEANNEINRIKDNTISDVFIGFETDLNDYPKPVYLRNFDTITFRLPKGNILVRLEKEELTIHASGEGDFIVKPNVSNSINLRLI